ncbi:MAG: hypothetical protein M1820_005643 [Bogoriella megaspora]|nr:MAG: hypothetical protein M1820_005643 [Bogoriella megaspora]
MGKLIKNHWARLIIMVASAYQIGASIEGFIWPKIFWDFLTKNLDGAVKPIPILQILNLLLGIVGLCYEYPLPFLKEMEIYKSFEVRLLFFPMSALCAALLYQGTNPALYYIIGIGVYFWAYSEGEVICPEPWMLPKPPPRSKV